MSFVNIDTYKISYLILVTEVPNQELKVLLTLLYPYVCKSKATVIAWCKYQLSGGLLDMPILERKGPVKVFCKVWHCCLVKHVIGMGYSKLGLHMEQ